MPEPSSWGILAWPLTYARAVYTIAWEGAATSRFWQQFTGVPIYSCATGMSIAWLGMGAAAVKHGTFPYENVLHHLGAFIQRAPDD